MRKTTIGVGVSKLPEVVLETNEKVIRLRYAISYLETRFVIGAKIKLTN